MVSQGRFELPTFPLGGRALSLRFWIEQRESGEVGGNVLGVLETISKNEEFISMMLAVLMTPE